MDGLMGLKGDRGFPGEIGEIGPIIKGEKGTHKNKLLNFRTHKENIRCRGVNKPPASSVNWFFVDSSNAQERICKIKRKNLKISHYKSN